MKSPDRPIVDALLKAMKEPPPPATPLLDADKHANDRTPIGQASMGVVLAANQVIANDNQDQRAGWEHRQERLAAWIVKVRAGDPPETLEQLLCAAIEGRLRRGQLVASSLGSPEWREILHGLATMSKQTAARMRLSGHKHAAVGRALLRVPAVHSQARAEMARIDEEAHKEIAAIGDDEARIAVVILAARTQVIGVSARACEELSAETGKLLGLDERTANVSVATFLADNGLSIDQSI